MAQSKSLKGPDIKVYVNGRLYTVVTSVRWIASYGRNPIMAIDQSIPAELASGPCTVKGTLDIVRLRNSGGLQGAGLVPDDFVILRERYFSLTIVDRLSDTVLLQVDEASVGEENWSVPSRGLISGSFTFEGIGWTNDVAG